MFKKQIRTGSATKIMPDEPQENFPKGSRFVMNNKIHHIVESFVDSSTEWRKVVSDVGEEELVMLSTLKKDAAAGAIEFIKKAD